MDTTKAAVPLEIHPCIVVWAEALLDDLKIGLCAGRVFLGLQGPAKNESHLSDSAGASHWGFQRQCCTKPVQSWLS